MSHQCKSLSVRLCVEGSGGDDKVGVPLEVNASEGIPFESPGFRGRVLLLNRPDEENPDWPYKKHFEGKQRRFEFRLQGVFTEDPGDNIFFGVEMAQVVGLGTALRLTANWIMNVVSILCAARGISYSYNLELQEWPNGDILRPYLAFPIVAADAIIVTPPGEAPPPLTEALDPVPLQEKRRIRFNTTDTFTFAYWSKQADFERWEMCNMPFGWSSSFTSFIGQQPVHLTAYRLDDGVLHEGPHMEARKRRLMSLVISNSRAEVSSSRAGPSVEADSPTRRCRPSAQRWSLESAELSVEEIDRLWLEEDEIRKRSKPEFGANSYSSWSTILTAGMCSCTAGRHGLR